MRNIPLQLIADHCTDVTQLSTIIIIIIISELELNAGQ